MFSMTTSDGEQLEFRSLTEGDADAFNAFRTQIAQETPFTFKYPDMPVMSHQQARERIAAWMATATTFSAGVFSADRLVAYLNFRIPGANHPWVRHIGEFGIMVVKSHWGHGIAKKLLALQDEFAKRQGVTRIEAHVRVPNERGVKLYTGAGYTIEGTRKRAALIDGEYMDEYYIAKLLTP